MKTRWIAIWLCAGCTFAGAQEVQREVRRWSLTDCIQHSLEHNLDLRIERYNPELALFNLRSGYGAYDPVLSASGQHDYSKAGSTLLEGTFTLPGREQDVNSFRTTLSGLLPWGTLYNVTLSARDTDGIRYGVDTNLNILEFPYSDSSGAVSISVTQPLLRDFWYNPTRLRIQILKNRLKWSEHALRARMIDIVTRVELAYYDLKAAYENVKVQQMALQLSEQLLAENRKRVEVGALAPLDEKQAEADVAARRADLIAAQRNLAVLENNLKQLLTDDFATWAHVRLEPLEELDAPPPILDVQDSWSKGLTLRPDFLQAQLDLEQQGIQVKINRNELYPQVDLRVGGAYSGSTPEFSGVFGDIKDRDQPSWFVGGQISYPLGNRSALNAYRASKAQYEQRLLALKKMEQDIMIEIDNAVKLAQANYERVAATREARAYAEAALEAEQKKLESGKSTSFVVLRLQRDLTAARADEISALVQYRRSLALLAQAEGSTLQRHGIDLVIK